jgi:hypothetical protein
MTQAPPTPLVQPTPPPQEGPITFPVAAAFCEAVPADSVSTAAGGPAEIVPEASGATVCTYRVLESGDETYDIIARVEDSFADLESVRQVFVDGQSIEGVGEGAYWVPLVTALWFESDGRLFAVQLVTFDGDDERALAIASAVAQLIESGLAP